MPGTAQTEFAFGPFLLRTRERILTRGGSPVPVGGRAFDVLAVLAASGQTVGKEVLMDQVWPGQAIEENNLQVHISALRKALGSEWIMTVPGRGYRLTSNAGRSGAAHGLEGRPSVAVKPFVSLEEDAERQHFAVGLAEEIATSLSRLRWISVITQSAASGQYGCSADMHGIGPEVDARYVLEGSVRGSGRHVRVLSRLVEMTTGMHIWADRFDGELSDVVGLQDQITARVIAAIDPKLFAAEIRRAQRDPVPSTRAYDLMLRALPLCFSCKREALTEGERLLRWALEIEPAYAPAMAALATHHWIMVSQGWIDRGDPSVGDMTNLAETALALDPEDYILLHILAEIVALPGGNLEGGLALIDRSLAINATDTFALAKAARLYAFAGNTGTAFSYLDRCFHLNSFSSDRGACFGRALAHFVDHDHAQAAEWAGKAQRANPNHAAALRYRAASLGLLGRLDEAYEVARRLLALVPDFTIARARRHVEFDMNNVFRTPGVADSLYEGLRRCGIPESRASLGPGRG